MRDCRTNLRQLGILHFNSALRFDFVVSGEVEVRKFECLNVTLERI